MQKRIGGGLSRYLIQCISFGTVTSKLILICSLCFYRISFEAMAFDNPMVFFLVCIAFVSGIGITPQSECSIIFSYSTFTCSFIVLGWEKYLHWTEWCYKWIIRHVVDRFLFFINIYKKRYINVNTVYTMNHTYNLTCKLK